MAVCAALTLTACTTAEQTSSQDDVTAAAKAVPAAEVVAAVQSATAAKKLPSSISPSRLREAAGDDESAWTIEGCDPGREETELKDLDPCVLGDVKSEKTMVLLGDSGAVQWHGAFDEIGKRKGWRVLVLAKNNCGPATMKYYQWQFKREFTECDAWQKWRMNVVKEQKAQAVVMAGWYGENLGPDTTMTPQIWRDGLVKTAEQLPEGTSVFFLGNPPHPSNGSPSECVAEHPEDLTACALPADEVPGQSSWSEAATAVGGTYIDIGPWFCASTCPAVVADRLVYAGQHHITVDYGRYLSGAIESVMTPVLAG
ncbi:MAG: SGNH hydrolase domain-containing protein [Gordonia sp. (in: high G+C Gram-positive bacteria)]|uniref:SGNH hydrolase domain-containing protein n=1 Tax=Gordonia sp. (in: high G+C Gram-positive bacteria) TaxID=84139 RepID=UPI0039E4E647